MLSNVVRIGSCALGLAMVVGVAGCQPQNQNGATTTTSMLSGGAGGTVAANQGRFPAPTYDQQAQPAYALTGDQSSPDAWSSVGHDFQVGNGRISLPAAP